jgi:hypothetical protein
MASRGSLRIGIVRDVSNERFKYTVNRATRTAGARPTLSMMTHEGTCPSPLTGKAKGHDGNSYLTLDASVTSLRVPSFLSLILTEPAYYHSGLFGFLDLLEGFGLLNISGLFRSGSGQFSCVFFLVFDFLNLNIF